MKVITFDVETTGIDPQRDQIIELCIQEGFKPKQTVKTWRIKPSVPVSDAAFRVHGISNKDLENCPSFSELASEILSHFNNAEVLIGYNIEFDISFMQAELARNNIEALDLKSIHLVDPLLIWRKCEPRNLSAAYKKFVGKELSNAHSAEADVAAAAEVLTGMIEQFDLKSGDWKSLAELSGLNRNNWVGPSYHLQIKDNQVVFGFGKFRNRSLTEIANSEDRSYLDWIAKKDDFPPHLKKLLKEAPINSDADLIGWINSNLNK